MNTSLRERGIETLHDQVVSLVAQRWAKGFQCRVTIKVETDRTPGTDPAQQWDIVGWRFGPRGNSLEWIAEVETEETLVMPDTALKWREAEALRVPIYLLVPHGSREAAAKLATAAGVPFNGIYEYACPNGTVQVL